MRTRLSVPATVLVIATMLAVSGAAMAQAPDPANNLGASENDVRPEPNHEDDENFLEDKDPFFSPKDDRLILDGYSEVRVGSDVAVAHDEDVSNIVNFAMHGENSDAYEQYILPGRNNFEAWWGYWSDTGSGGSLQANDATSDQFGDPNGAIDDADDCSDTTWDEFTWRGPNVECASIPGADSEDSMYGFVQPGTHTIHINSIVLGCGCPEDMLLNSTADESTEPDWRYQNNDEVNGQMWYNGNGFARYFYDASLVMSTQVVTSVNPESQGDGEFDPYTSSSSAPIHAHDIDIYSSLHPAIEDAYRTTVWNPGEDYGDDDEETNVGSAVHENGLKGFAKYPFHRAYVQVQEDVFENVSQAQEGTEPVQGFADDLAFGPYKHEPNTADDDYEGRASFDAATSYGGLEGDYYEPGPGQTYDAYQTGEHFWLDAKVGVNSCPAWVPSGAAPGQEGTNCYNGWAHLTPEIPSTSNPVESTASEGDDNTFGPTVLYWNGNAGMWHDENGDTWIGDAHEGTADDYNDGTTDDPNNYGSDEFRGSISVSYDVELVPTEDTDGDGINDWGTTGVYVMGTFDDGNPYSDAAADLLGDNAQPVGDAFRDNTPTGEYILPDDENGQLSRYRTQGPIDMAPILKPAGTSGTGTAFSGVAVVFPAGNLDAPFEVRSKATLEDPDAASEKGTNKGVSLTGQSVLDVDDYESILGSS